LGKLFFYFFGIILFPTAFKASNIIIFLILFLFSSGSFIYGVLPQNITKLNRSYVEKFSSYHVFFEIFLKIISIGATAFLTAYLLQYWGKAPQEFFLNTGMILIIIYVFTKLFLLKNPIKTNKK